MNKSLKLILSGAVVLSIASCAAGGGGNYDAMLQATPSYKKDVFTHMAESFSYMCGQTSGRQVPSDKSVKKYTAKAHFGKLRVNNLESDWHALEISVGRTNDSVYYNDESLEYICGANNMKDEFKHIHSAGFKLS